MASATKTTPNDVAVLEKKVELLEDIEDVRQLKSRFAKQFDRTLNSGGPFPQPSLLAFFTPDATWTSTQFGTYKGREQIEAFLTAYKRRVSFAIDYCVGHLVEIAADRQSATGFWSTWQPLTLDGKAYLLAGRYYDKYVRVGDRKWLFSEVKLEVEFLAPYNEGWATNKLPPDWKW